MDSFFEGVLFFVAFLLFILINQVAKSKHLRNKQPLIYRCLVPI
ncbi:hypothetical protein QE390_005170 [Siphonobacter sp. SORGH_AS 1065]|nr:hypothetical protein [Siphonobacter sp. SORGH_AS_1065]